jgi:hypothetical protein
MRNRPATRAIGFSILIVALFLPPLSHAQDASTETKGVNVGNYNMQQSFEAGYRASWINGDQSTYNTFVNLAQGFRLLDYTVDMRSLDHNGFLFDNLNFSNFGYGGDPNDVTRLRIEKNKWYDFRGLFRRDKNLWDWSLMANPLNPASSVVPTPILSSPHSLDLVRRMQDYSLTLLPQSKVRVRLGYSRVVNEGPAFTTLDGGTEPMLNQNFKITTNSYHAGVDFRILPRTTISYDQFFKYFKQDTVTFDQIPQTSPFFNNGNYQFLNPGGAPSPVDLGIVWTATAGGGSPCGSPIITPGSPATVKPVCNGYFNTTFNGLPLPAYNKSGRGRNNMPTERFSFQSSYFRRFEMTGSFGYSSGDNTVNDFLEAQSGLATRTAGRGSILTGPAEAKRVSVNGDWSGVYSITDKLRLVNMFRYENWRIPGIWTQAETNLFAVHTPAPPPVFAGMQLPISTLVLNPAGFGAACPPPFTAAGCPVHSASSLADVDNAQFQRFLGQRLISNTVQLEYDFNRRLKARIGYQYSDRVISNFFSSRDVQEIYFPGGGGNAANAFLAGRADCTSTGAIPGVYTPPVGCTLNPDGTITETGLEGTSDTSRNITTIHEHALLAGITARPIEKLRITGDVAIGYNDNTFTRTAPRQIQTYKVHASYRPKTWATIDGAIDIHENRDNVFTVNNLEHDRTYSFNTVLSPNPRLSVDFGYTYADFFSQADICYDSGVVNPGVTTTLCPNGAPGTATLGATSSYSSTAHYIYGDMVWKVMKRVTAGVGFGGNFVRGTSNFFNQPQFAAAPAPALGQVSLNLLTPSGTLDFNYLKPHALVAIDICKGLTYKMAWDYYGYNAKGPGDPAALAPIGVRDFNGSNATFSFRYAF